MIDTLNEKFEEELKEMEARYKQLWDEYVKTKDITIYERFRTEKKEKIEKEIARLKPIIAEMWKKYNASGDQSIKAEIKKIEAKKEEVKKLAIAIYDSRKEAKLNEVISELRKRYNVIISELQKEYDASGDQSIKAEIDRIKAEEAELEKLITAIYDALDKNAELNEIISELQKNYDALKGKLQKKYNDSCDRELKEKIDYSEARIKEYSKMKLYGLIGEGPVDDIDKSAAIPLGPSETNAKFDPESISNDASPEIDPDLSEEEKKIEFLCCGIKYDGRAKYATRNLHTEMRIHYIPISENANRTGTKIKRSKKIVPHEVQLGLGHSNPDRDVPYYENLLYSTYLKNGSVGYHFLCSDNEIVCFIPWDEKTAHASSVLFNNMSIGIERITTKEVEMDAVYNQAKLIATLMYLENIPINRIMTHFDCTVARRLPIKDEEGNVKVDKDGNPLYLIKSCPDRLLNGEYGGLRFFKQVIINCLRTHDLFLDDLRNIKGQYEWLDTIYSPKPRLGPGR